MNQYQSSADLKNTARKILSGKYGTSMLTIVLVELAVFLLQFPFVMIASTIFSVESMMTGSPINERLLSIIEGAIAFPCNIIGGVFQTGLALYFLNIACGKKYSVTDIFFGFRWQLKKSLALSAILVVINTICMLPYNILVYNMQSPFQMSQVIVLAIAYLGAVIIQIPVTLMFSQTFYLLLDFPQLSVKQLLQRSIRIMKGHKRRLLYIQLSFLPLEFLCIFSFFIGYLWLIPYQDMTYALFFLDIMNPKKTADQSAN